MQDGFTLGLSEPRPLGATPLGPVPLPMGSYVVVLESEDGRAAVRYPVHIRRNRDWSGEVRLYDPDDVGGGRDLVHVSAGPFVSGGDPLAFNGEPRAEPELGDYAIGRYPVTMGEYLEFLNDLADREGLAAAKARAPRPPGEGAATYFVESPDGGRLQLPADADEYGDVWDRRLPAMGASWHDANAYCGWLSDREGRLFELPTEQQWEKAARGVDGRWFPWGNEFDPSLANTVGSLPERLTIVSVDESPADESVYGVRAMGGNVRDWTASDGSRGAERARGSRVVRGGTAYWEPHWSRCASRGLFDPDSVDATVGFRLMARLDG